MTGSLGGSLGQPGSGEFTRVACRSFLTVSEAIAVPIMAALIAAGLYGLHRRALVKLTGRLKYLVAWRLSAFSAACARDIARKDDILEVGARFEAQPLSGKRTMQSGCFFYDDGPAATDIAVNIAGDNC